jgi:hypothetical protein
LWTAQAKLALGAKNIAIEIGAATPKRLALAARPYSSAPDICSAIFSSHVFARSTSELQRIRLGFLCSALWKKMGTICRTGALNIRHQTLRGP